LKPRIDVSSLILDGDSIDLTLCTKERSAHLGRQFFPSVSLAISRKVDEGTVEPMRCSCPVSQFMEEASMVILCIAKMLYPWNYYLVIRRHISRQLADLDSWPLFEALHEGDACTQGYNVSFFALWSLDTTTLTEIENGRVFEETADFDLFRTIWPLLLAYPVIGVDDKGRGFLATFNSAS
jgi:hypothetical protein